LEESVWNFMAVGLQSGLHKTGKWRLYDCSSVYFLCKQTVQCSNIHKFTWQPADVLYVESWNMLLFWSLTAVAEVLSVVLVPVSDNTYIIQLWRQSFAPLVTELDYIFLKEFIVYVFLWNQSK